MTLFVTGGSRGIGRAIVQAGLLAGHDVAFTFVAAERAAEEVLAWAADAAPERRCFAHRLDVGDSAAVERVGDAVLDDLEQVDAVICNAGVVHNQLAVQTSDADWDRVVRTNLAGSFYVARHFLMPFVGAGYGRLVFVGSVAQHGLTGQVAYAASKAGLTGLAKTLAKEYGAKGITSNVVVPGFFDTDMTRETMAASHQAFWTQHCPLGRLGRLEEIAEVVLFLASKGSSFVNGQVIGVTGGLDWAV
jgi:3-oxoacyl-[acyl-carrier protein] reductase